jgi:hypothetical protein
MKPILAPTLLLIAAPLGAQERLGEVLRIAPGREWTYEGNSRYTAFDGELRHTFRLRFLAYDRTAEGRTSMIVQRRIESSATYGRKGT